MKQKHVVFNVVGYTITIFVVLVCFWILLNLGGCKSFEKTTGYKQNQYWGT